jgi:uncharacterized protein (UPF0305 family)
MNNPDLVHPYYTTNWWREADTRHINPRGHQDLANLLASLVQDTACELVEIEEGDEDEERGKSRNDKDDDDDDDDNKREQERMDMVLDKILTEHFKTQPGVPLHPAKEFYQGSFDIQQQREIVAEDDKFWTDQPKDVRPWGPWQRAKHDEGEPERLWEGVWPGDWQHGEVPRVSPGARCGPLDNTPAR